MEREREGGSRQSRSGCGVAEVRLPVGPAGRAPVSDGNGSVSLLGVMFLSAPLSE